MAATGRDSAVPNSQLSRHYVGWLVIAGVLALALPTATAATPHALLYGSLPLRFEANEGQTDPLVKFLARGRGYALFLTATDAILVLNPPPRSSRRERGGVAAEPDTAVPSTVTMRLVGAKPTSRLEPLDRLPGASHYLIGADPKRWHRGVPVYARIRYDEIYPGVSLVYYGNQGQLEYDFVVSPGADPTAIALEFEGATGLRVDERGDLMIGTASREVRLHRPLVYQEIDGARRHLDGGYTVEEGRRVRFRVAAWDASRPLVIDPVLVYSTYLGGGGNDHGFGIAVDVAGGAYITGSTISADFPTAGAPQATKSGVTDAFVTKLDASGSNVVYSTYLGGNGDDAGNAIAVDASGNAYVAGQTASTNFPFVNAFQTTRRSLDGFLAKIDPTGANLVYSTLLGGSADDVILGVAVDGSGDAVVTGSTSSTDFPTARALQASLRAGSDAFVAKFTTTGAGLVYSTFLGGSGDDVGSAVAVDASGNAYVVGSTTSTNFPAVGAFQSVKTAGVDAFVAKLDAAGTSLVFSTYLGGAGDDEGNAIAVAPDGSAVTVVGDTTSTNFPTSGAIQPANGGTTDAFVTKLAGTGNGLLFSTYLGGVGVDIAHGVAVHSDGSTYVVGTTRSTNFPVFNALIGGGVLAGGADVFLTKLIPTDPALGYSTYLGGAGDETGNAIALDADGIAYIAGSTNSTAFPTVDPVQGSLGGGLDAFVAQVADGGIVQFSAPTFTVQENSGSVTVIVTRTGDRSGAVTVNLATSDGTATGGAVRGPGVDYLTRAGTLTFGPGETAKTFTVPLSDDSDGEGDETFLVTLSAPSGGAVLGARNTATVKIVDDEASVNFSTAVYTVTEGSGAVITVVRSGPAPLAGTVLVGYVTEDGTATGAAVAGPGVDYVISTGTLTFGPGVTTRTFTVPTVNDTLAESTETVRLRLTSVTGGTPPPLPGVRATATLNLNDNDAGGVVQFSAPTFSVAEGTPTATITVTRSSGAAGNVTVDFATSDGTAQAGVNYVATSGTLTFGAGTTSRSFTVPIINNTAGQGVVRANLTLSNATGGALLGSRSTATLIVVDDEPNISFTTERFTVSEAATAATITVRRNGPLTGTVTVQYATSNGTATGGAVTGPGIDYLTRAGTLTFGPGVASKTFTVPIVNDTVVEGNKTILLTLSNPLVVGGGAMSIAGTNPATLAILDNDQGGFIEFDSATYTVIENAGFAQIKVKRTGGLASGVTVQYATNDGVGTALAGADYTPTNNTLTFAAGELTKTFTIPIFNDTIDEGIETVVLVLSGAGGGGSLGARDTATLTIVDDDTAGVVQFSAPVYTVSEAATQATITVKRTGGLATGLGATGITVDYATSDGTATAGSDYTATTGSVTFAAGQLTATFTVPLPADDPTKEGNETVLLTLSNPQGGATLGPQKTALLKIVDNENSTVQFNAATYTVLEGGSAVVTVERTGTAGLPGTVTVQYAAAAGGPTPATPVVDFTPVAGTLTFGPGVATRTFSVATKTNAVPSGPRTIALTLSNPQPLATAILAPQSTAVLSIVDNDAGGQIQWSSANYQAREGAGLMYLIAKRTGGLAGGVTVPYTVVDGTARAGQHFTLASGTLTFAAGAVQVNVPTLITPQNTVETGPLTFTVVMGTPQPAGFATSATLGSPSTATVTIVDDDEGGVVQFGVLSVRVAENAALCTALPPANACAKVTVTRTGGAASAVTADYSMADGTAVANVHYVQTSGQVSFAAGQTSATIPVQLINDGTNNGLRTFTITLSNARGGATIGVNSSLQVQIADND